MIGRMSTLARVQDWFASQCDGEWEQTRGVSIGSCDNPGWWVKVNLAGTTLAGQEFREIAEGVDAQRFAQNRFWISCRVEGSIWHGAGDATQLERILAIFLDWADERGRLEKASAPEADRHGGFVRGHRVRIDPHTGIRNSPVAPGSSAPILGASTKNQAVCGSGSIPRSRPGTKSRARRSSGTLFAPSEGGSRCARNGARSTGACSRRVLRAAPDAQRGSHQMSGGSSDELPWW